MLDQQDEIGRRNVQDLDQRREFAEAWQYGQRTAQDVCLVSFDIQLDQHAHHRRTCIEAAKNPVERGRPHRQGAVVAGLGETSRS